MREQRLMVTGLYRPGWCTPGVGSQVPLLLLCGSWLTEAGFDVGAAVRVVVEPGRLVVMPRESGSESAAGGRL